jgi:hypothetical protein
VSNRYIDSHGYLSPLGRRERVVDLNLGETNHPLGFHIPNFQTQTTEDFHWIERGILGDL